MLIHLQQIYGEKPAGMLLGVPIQSFRAWRDGRRYVSGSAIRAIWLIYCLALRPDRVQSLFDLATWGRFRLEVKPRSQEPDWQI